MENYKFSRYNELIPVPEDNSFLIFNIQKTSLDVIDAQDGLLLSELASVQKFNYSDIGSKELMDDFIAKGYIVPEKYEEINLAEKAYLKSNKGGSAILITITTTTICNMDCPYCFEVNKPSVVLKDSTLLKNIKKYIKSMTEKSPPNTYDNLQLTWYGGEPLINVKSIQDLTPLILEICHDYNLSYKSNIITNGIYLTDENVKILTECFVDDFQVTIDGPEHTHNKNRPLKGKNQENYTKIMRHLSALPESVHISLRINTDREVADGIDELLDDLEKYKIWPHRVNNMNIEPTPVVAYEGTQIEANDEKYLDHRDFFDFKQNFRRKKVERYNRFQSANGGKISKLSWALPRAQSDCGTWGEESGLVIDPRGNIHKCWETVHLKEEAVVKAEDLDKEFSSSPYEYYTSYNRYNVKTACRMCKFISVCDKITCQKQALESTKPACTIWKFRTKDFIKEQYLTYVNTPELIGEPA